MTIEELFKQMEEDYEKGNHFLFSGLDGGSLHDCYFSCNDTLDSFLEELVLEYVSFKYKDEEFELIEVDEGYDDGWQKWQRVYSNRNGFFMFEGGYHSWVGEEIDEGPTFCEPYEVTTIKYREKKNEG